MLYARITGCCWLSLCHFLWGIAAGLPCPTIIVEAYPAGTVITPTSAPFAVWSNIPTISAAEGAAPVARVILDDEYAHAVALEQERGQPKVPPWAMDLFNHSEGSLDRFLEEV